MHRHAFMHACMRVCIHTHTHTYTQSQNQFVTSLNLTEHNFCFPLHSKFLANIVILLLIKTYMWKLLIYLNNFFNKWNPDFQGKFYHWQGMVKSFRFFVCFCFWSNTVLHCIHPGCFTSGSVQLIQHDHKDWRLKSRKKERGKKKGSKFQADTTLRWPNLVEIATSTLHLNCCNWGSRGRDSSCCVSTLGRLPNMMYRHQLYRYTVAFSDCNCYKR